jgi:NAD+ synthase
MLLTTGNKSEVAVGYATIYGDMAGATTRSRISTRPASSTPAAGATKTTGPGCRAAGAVIPPRMIDKPPTAELRENQKDEDSLPPYPVLDAILEGLVEEDASVADLVAQGVRPRHGPRVEALLYGANGSASSPPPACA